jgi:hypothetical protein
MDQGVLELGVCRGFLYFWRCGNGIEYVPDGRWMSFTFDQGSGVWDGFIARYCAIHCGLLHDFILC